VGREKVLLIVVVFSTRPSQEKGFDSALPHIQIDPDLIFQHPPENRIDVVQILQEFAQNPTSFLGLEFIVGEAGHVAEDGLFGAGYDEGGFTSGGVNLRPSPGAPILLDGTKPHDLIGPPILSIPEMDHPALFDLQCSLQP